jgi:NitT/TauT family transport system substrate-binding protein
MLGIAPPEAAGLAAALPDAAGLALAPAAAEAAGFALAAADPAGLALAAAEAGADTAAGLEAGAADGLAAAGLLAGAAAPPPQAARALVSASGTTRLDSFFISRLYEPALIMKQFARMSTRMYLSLTLSGLLLAACGSGAATPSPSTTAAGAKPADSSSTAPSAAAKPAGSGAASAAASGATAASAQVHVKIGQINLIGEAGLDVAFERGYFKEQGLDVEFERFKSGADQVPAMSAGQIDFGSTSPDPGMFNAVARGLALKIIAPQATTLPGDKHAAFVVRKDILDGGKYKTPADLKGMTIAAGPVPGTTGQLLVEDVLKKGGLTTSDVNLLSLPYADVATAMANKKIDAAWDVEPNIANGQELGVLQPVMAVDEISPGALGEALLMSPGFAKDHAGAARKLAVAHLKGQRDYYRAVEKNEGGRDEVVGILVKHGLVKDAKTFDRLGLNTVAPNDEMDLKALGDYEDYFVKTGGVKERVDVNQVVDTTYADYAVQQLGKM